MLATRVGGHVELVRPGATGWLVAPGEDGLADGARRGARPIPPRARDGAIGERAPVARRADRPQARSVAAYRDARRAAPRAAAHVPRERPLVSAIVPYKGMAAYVEEAVASLEAQTYPRLETVIVCDGSFDPADEVLHELEAPVPRACACCGSRTAGSAARATRASCRAAARYVFALDADNVAEPEFVERAVELLEDDPRLAYVTVLEPLRRRARGATCSTTS